MFACQGRVGQHVAVADHAQTLAIAICNDLMAQTGN
jgi:hypothetical protein